MALFSRPFGRFFYAPGASSAFATVLLVACSPEPSVAPDEIRRAKLIYTSCVQDELGIELESLEISPSGDIDVRFGPGTSDEAAARAAAVCEPRIGSVLEPGGISVLGPPRNLGRLGTDADLDALLAERERLGFQGAISAVFRGEPRLRAGFGQLSPGSPRSPDAATAFDCGSIMKDVTLALILLLEDEAALSRTQTLGELFDDVPSVWASVTLQQVIEHRAGFAPYHDTEGDFEEMDRATALQLIFAQEPLFPPGTSSEYSSSGYTLLAAVIEDAASGDFRTMARRLIFEPLGMARSGFYGEGLWEDGNVAIGSGGGEFDGNDPSRWPAPTWALMGNGGLVSTMDDLLRLLRWFDTGLFPTLEAERPEALASAPHIAGRPLFAGAGGNDFGFNALVLDVLGDSTYIVAASHVLSPVSAEILGMEVLQTLYGEELPRDAGN
jgi:CubicO group peptidase (beta-lactamase class C family)